MSAKKVGLCESLLVRWTLSEKKRLRARAAELGVDMSVYVRSVVIDELDNGRQHREDMLTYQRQLAMLTEHIIRMRAVLNADIRTRYADDGEAVAELADELQRELA